jgi:molybdopterin-containing oxidoreductase family iron-sulfur binding subunit
MGKKQHWQTLAELENNPDYIEQASREFPEELPVVDFMEDVTKVEKTGRRDFLKMLGFSVSAAAVAASCKIPVKRAVPYVFDNADGNYRALVPGVAEYFASTYMDNGGFSNILVKTREGRPIKIEGNPDGSVTGGSTSARAQASVLDLYDHTRLKAPCSGSDPGTALSWEAVDAEVIAGLDKLSAAGEQVVVLSQSLASPVHQSAIDALIEKYPNVKQVTYDAVSMDAVRSANEITLGQRIIPGYHFDKARVIVGVNCDFLGTWLSPVEFAEQYGRVKVPTKANGKEMVRHYQFQSNVTITGSSADYKFPVRPSEEKATLVALYNAIAAQTGAPALNGGSDVSKDMITQTASDLLNARGASLVVCGTNDLDCQLIVNAINAALDNYGATINTTINYNVKSGSDSAFLDFVEELEGGGVKGLITLNANPVYETPFGAEIAEAMSGLELCVSLADRIDETSANASTVCPGRHYLESWNVLEPKTGQYCFVQPTINPLFTDTRPHLESLLAWSGNAQSSYDYMREFVAANVGGSEQDWINTVRSGMASAMLAQLALTPDVDATVSEVSNSSSSSSGVEVVLYESVAIGDGTMANNPFLQELADPLARATWDNFLAISDDLAEANGIKDWYNNKIVPTATVAAGGHSVTLPVVVVFGMAPNTAAIALGYGRTSAGMAGNDVGQDVYPWVSQSGRHFKYTLQGAAVNFDSTPSYKLAMVQVFGTLQEEYALPGRKAEFRGGIVKETNLAAYKESNKAGNEDRDKILHHLDTMYPTQEFQGHHWGMAIDLNSCNGCGACIVACNVENNVPVVGKTEVFRGHDMHWMRIDRYYSGDKSNPDVAFQPMLCQHCDNAPCENVCPVNATNHSSEGLNQMAYNRCIGTRYCANNCPYKVRRFNWLDYQAVDYFGKFNDNRKGFGQEGETDYMYDDLTRMVLNPDVTVRVRGVIEKCSFCVQRIQQGKLDARNEGRPLKDGDIKTACQTVCPPNAIVFGDLNDENSEVHKLFNSERNYHALEEQHFLPSVGYAVKVRNKDEKPAKNFS